MQSGQFATITPTPSRQPTSTVVATKVIVTDTATLTPTITPLPVEKMLSNMQDSMLANLVPTQTPAPSNASIFSGIDGVSFFSLNNPLDNNRYWVFHSTGSRSFDPIQNHFLSIVTTAEDYLQEVESIELPNPDFLDKQSVTQVFIEPRDIWIQVQGGAGAHSGCFDLIRFDGDTLENIISDCSSSPHAGETRDLDGNGYQEVILNWTQDYVFCYACGVRIRNYQVLRWDGFTLTEIQLRELPNSYPEQLVSLNNQAVRHANADLWMQANQYIQRATILEDNNQVVRENAMFIGLIAESRRDEIKQSSFPIISLIFYGDYESALDIMRSYRPKELFSKDSPIIKSTVAEDWLDQLYVWISDYAQKAIAFNPEFAPAYFFRAWVAYLMESSDPNVSRDLNKAVELDVNEHLYSDSLIYLSSNP